MLRIVSATKYFMRTATGDTVIRGQEIAAGEVVYCSIMAANRDPEPFPDPHRLDVARSFAAGSHIAFGHGPHFCIGAPLARLDLRLALSGLLRRFSSWRIVGEPVRGRPSTQLNKLARLPMVFDERTG
jgi:cytochrome P450